MARKKHGLEDQKKKAGRKNSGNVYNTGHNAPVKESNSDSRYPGDAYEDGHRPADVYGGGYDSGEPYDDGHYPEDGYGGGRYPDDYDDGRYPEDHGDGRYPEDYDDGQYPEDYDGGRYPEDYDDGRYPEDGYDDRRYPGDEYYDDYYAENSGDGVRYPEDAYEDGRYSGRDYDDRRYPEDAYENRRYSDGVYGDGRYSEDAYDDGYDPGNEYNDGRHPEDGYDGGRYPEDGYDDGHYPADAYDDGRYPEDGYDDGHYPADAYDDGRYPEDAYYGSGDSEEPYLDGRYYDRRHPGGQYGQEPYPGDGARPDRGDASGLKARQADSHAARSAVPEHVEADETYAVVRKDNDRKSRRRGVKAAVILFVLAGLGAGGYFGYRYYQPALEATISRITGMIGEARQNLSANETQTAIAQDSREQSQNGETAAASDEGGNTSQSGSGSKLRSAADILESNSHGSADSSAEEAGSQTAPEEASGQASGQASDGVSDGASAQTDSKKTKSSKSKGSSGSDTVSKLFSAYDTAPELALVNPDGFETIHSAPGSADASPASLSKNAFAAVLDRETSDTGSGSWLFIDYLGTQGYVPAEGALLVSKDQLGAYKSDTVYITSMYTVLYENPSRTANQVMGLGYGNEATLLSAKDGWAELSCAGNKGWIEFRHFGLYLPGRYTAADPNGANQINVYEKPDSSSASAGIIPNGETLEITEFQSGWGKVSYGSVNGWVSLQHVTPASSEAQVSTPAQNSQAPTPAPAVSVTPAPTRAPAAGNTAAAGSTSSAAAAGGTSGSAAAAAGSSASDSYIVYDDQDDGSGYIDYTDYSEPEAEDPAAEDPSENEGAGGESEEPGGQSENEQPGDDPGQQEDPGTVPEEPSDPGEGEELSWEVDDSLSWGEDGGEDFSGEDSGSEDFSGEDAGSAEE